VVTIDPRMIQLPVIEGQGIRFVGLNRSQGISQQRVTSMAQDQTGFLWLGTHFGLNRYDGYHFKIFEHDPADPGSPFEVPVTALFVDRSGVLWVGCDYALDRYDPLTQSFVHYQLAPSPAIAGQIHNISQDHTGALWLSTDNGLYRLDPASGATRRFGHDETDPWSLSSDSIRSSGEDRSGTFWVATSEGLDTFDREHARVLEHVPLREARDFSFYEDRAGVFWVLYASGNGLAILDRTTRRLTRYSFGREDLPNHPLTGVSSMIEDREGNLWIGTFSDGLLKYDRARRCFVRYRHDPVNDESLPENRVTALLQDQEKNVWVAFGATEPAFFSTRPASFEALPFDHRNAGNLGEKLVNGIYEDREGIVWLAVTGGLVRFDRKTGDLSHLLIPGQDPATDVLSTVEDTDGALWVGTSGQGLYRRMRGSDRLTAFRHDDRNPRSLSDDTVPRLLIDRAGTLWVGTRNGLDRFNPRTQDFTTFSPATGGETNGVFDLAEGAAGTLLVGSYVSGAFWFDPRSGSFTALRPPPSERHTAFGRLISLLIDHTGSVWIASLSGLDHYDARSRWLAHYSEKDGLPRNVIGCVLEDSAGGLWMGTGDGVSHFDPRKNLFTNYTQADGLPGPDFTGWRACYRAEDDEMFMGGFSGAVAFHPERVATLTAYQPPVALTAFELSGKPVTIGPRSVLKRAIDHTAALTLTHDQGSFALSFAALSLTDPPSNRYRFKLEGFDEDWMMVGADQRRAAYTALPPGSYVFRVQGATARGPWAEPGVSVAIRILPPWWSTWWFRLSCLVTVTLLASWLYRLRLRQASERITLRMEERLAERTRIAQELHDTVLQGLLGVLMQMGVADDKVPGSDPMKRTFAGLLASLRRVAEESRNAVQGLRKLAERPETLAATLGSIPEDLSIGPGTALQIRIEGEPRALKPHVQEEIYLVCREAIANAFRHAQATEIDVIVRYSSAQLDVSIRDNGVGIGAEMAREGRLGHFGLQGMRERVARLRATLQLAGRPGEGTRADFSIAASVAFEGRSRRASARGLADSRSSERDTSAE
jgi:ligand-binding sensor domain-containing protein/signal transduction histidine kinase